MIPGDSAGASSALLSCVACWFFVFWLQMEFSGDSLLAMSALVYCYPRLVLVP